MTQDPGIIEIDPWLDSPAGRYLLAWEQAQFDQVVADLFGYHALQVGWPVLHTLRANRMRHRWVLSERSGSVQAARAAAVAQDDAPDSHWGPAPRVSVVADVDALPFPAQSLDLVVLPHTLEISADPHQTLREVERVLVPDGRVIVAGFNPMSLLGVQRVADPMLEVLGLTRARVPTGGELIGTRRLRDWLKLLDFEIEHGQYGCYRPVVGSQRWLQLAQSVEGAGARWWPILGSVYMLQAVKRVRGMRLVGLAPRRHARRAAAAAPAAVASRHLSRGG